MAIVVDREFGERLAPLARAMSVWIVDSASNSAAMAGWRRATSARPHGEGFDAGVTSFRAPEEQAPERLVVGILSTVDLHHGEFSNDPPWSEIEVHGADASAALRAAFADYGAQVSDEWPGGFRVRRR